MKRHSHPTPFILCRRTLVLFVLLTTTMLSGAQTADTLMSNKEITNVQIMGIGTSQILDTYLSPEKFTGTELRYISHTTREEADSRYSQQIVHQAQFATVDDRSGDGDEMLGLYNFNYALHYNWQFMEGRLNIKAGGQVDLNAGVLYNTRNQNNPAQMRLSAFLSPSAVATYQFHIKRMKCSARYELSVPLVGVMFSPNYGQSYYEIFSRGNYDHNAVPVTIFSAPSMRNMLSVDFTLRHITFRVGYLGDFQQAEVNNLKQHTYTHALMLGVVKHFKLLHIR